MSPICAGKFSFILSHWWRPRSVDFQRLKPYPAAASAAITMYQLPVMKSEMPTTIRVGSGSCELTPGVSSAISMKMLVKTGTTKAQTAAITRIAMTSTATGYIIAERT